MAHRALILSYLATVSSPNVGIGDLLDSRFRGNDTHKAGMTQINRDLEATRRCLDVLREGAGKKILDCGESGTTFRLLMGMLAGIPGEATLVAHGSLVRRPMDRVIEPLREMG